MKKTYIIPALHVTSVIGEQLIAESLLVDEEVEVDEQYVKENNFSRPGYNVWDDDWSK